MKNIMILAGLVAFAVAAPAHAQPAHAKGGKAKQGQVDPHAGHYGHTGPTVMQCPPGLAKKHNGCLPPGQAKKLYNVGQRFPGGYGQVWTYNQVPYDWRRQYDLDPRSRYYYGDGYLYSVDPTTMLVQQVIQAIIR